MIRRVLTLTTFALLLALTGCAKIGSNTLAGTAGGTALGAGLGAIIGSATGHTGPGIAIGAGMGALAGATVGQALDSNEEQLDVQTEELDRQRSQIEENRRLINQLRRRGVDVRETKRGVVVNLPDILFEFGAARLTGEARRNVSDITDILGKEARGRQISVEGHTDSVGSFSFNQDLAERRADSVARELEYNGLSRGIVRSRGYGESRPIASNNSDQGRARNRRVEVIVEN